MRSDSYYEGLTRGAPVLLVVDDAQDALPAFAALEQLVSKVCAALGSLLHVMLLSNKELPFTATTTVPDPG